MMNGLPPGLARKADAGNLPSKNPHVQAYMAQQQAEQAQQQNAQLQQQLQEGQARQAALQQQNQQYQTAFGFTAAALGAFFKYLNQNQNTPPGDDMMPMYMDPMAMDPTGVAPNVPPMMVQSMNFFA